ncbi:MAG: type II toxin-antitoxin system VapC family toxin [Microbacteriaceae bacterium]
MYLLDTHVLLWWLSDDRRLSTIHRDIISDGKNAVAVSSISTAEIAIKASMGKLGVPSDLGSTIAASAFSELAFDQRHALELRDLAWHHRDPFDRMLISQARVDNLTLLTADRRIAEYDVKIL